MLTPARMTQLMMEVIFILLGGLVFYLGATGRIYMNRHGLPMLVMSVALIVWGLLAFARPVTRWAQWEKWNRGLSLVILGILLLAMTRVPFLWVPRLLIVVGFVLVTRGLFATLMILKQS